jgi:starch-binding outer membrane protein, SusD/RagB family
MKKLKISLVGIGIFLLVFSSCTSDLDTQPKVELTLEKLLQRDPNAIKGLLSKMYATFALTGPGGAGTSDIAGPDAGETGFLRGIINLQDLTTDNVKNRWGDDGLDQLTTSSNWDSNNKFFRYLYDRVYYTVPQCNNLLKVLEVVDVPNKEQVKSELRFLRSLAYYYMIDCFGKGVIVTPDDLGSNIPKAQSSRIELFNYVESELLDIENKLPATNGYGQANQSVARMLLARLYLNANVYTGTPRWNDALIYSKKVIDLGGYTLATNYGSIFSADNNTSNAKNEIIFPLIADALNSQSYGNTTYLVNASLKSDTMNLSTYGATDGWGGNRATKAWYGLYGNSAGAISANTDARARLFWSTGHTYEMTDYKEWTNGFAETKYRNSNYYGASTNTAFSSTDFPLFRLADAYLMYAECVLRGATGGTIAQAYTYVRAIRDRATAPTAIFNSASDLTLNFILDERARELNLEGIRRTDLIRFGKFTGATYLWPWKGNSLAGNSIPSTYDVFPIPATALTANPNLTQNPGY